MQKPLAIAATAAAAAALAGCTGARSESGGPTVQRSYQVGGFERIEVAGPYEVDVRTGSDPSVQASGPEKTVERMIVEVDGDTLKIHSRKRRSLNFGWSNDHVVRLMVTVPALRGAEIAGSGGINVDRVTGDSFEGAVAGSGDLQVGQVDVQRLSMGIAGSGEIRAGTGRARRVEYEIAGSGDIDAGALAAEEAQVSIAGSGNVRANATRAASVDIAGSGDVQLTGGAKCQVSKAGSGNVTCS
jgi:hypothetical protein